MFCQEFWQKEEITEIENTFSLLCEDDKKHKKWAWKRGKIKKGKHSSNPRLQSLLASVNRRNVNFFHNSAKDGLHVVPDHLSRMSDTACQSKDCVVERYLYDIPIHMFM